MFLNSFNLFRAIAIVLIVACHCYYISNINFDTTWENTIKNIITGNTISFVFISGFLFYHVFYKKFVYSTFVKGKILNVFLPYLLLSFLPIIISYNVKPYFHSALESGELKNINQIQHYILPTLKYFVSGSHMIAYWYIPFILLIFIFSPIHMFFIKQKTSVQLGVTFLLFIVAAFIHRPLLNNNYLQAIHSFVYFSPIYLIGIMSSIYKDKIYSILQKKEIILCIIVLSLAFFQTKTGNQGLYQKDFFAYKGIDLMLIQKTVLSILLMVWLHRFEHVNNKYINYIASTSFAIFFLHGYFLKVLLMAKTYFGITFSTPWIAYIVIVVLLITLCVLSSIFIKKIFLKNSRKLIGY